MDNPVTLHGDLIDEIRSLPDKNIFHHILTSIESKYNSGKITEENFDSLSTKLIFDYINDKSRLKKTLKDKITVIDSIMGTGKSTYIINYINNNPDLHFICIVPTLEEIERYKNSIEATTFEPIKMPTKSDGLKHLIHGNRNIIATHSLISRIDSETINLLKTRHYILIIDECLDVVHPYNDNFNKKDLKLLFDADYIEVDKDGFIRWKDNAQDHDGRYTNVKNLCNLSSLMVLKKKNGEWSNQVLIWCMPVSFFSLFEKCYILTYLFDGSMQNAYFKLNQIEYTHMSLLNGVLVPFNSSNEQAQRKGKYNLIRVC